MPKYVYKNLETTIDGKKCQYQATINISEHQNQLDNYVVLQIQGEEYVKFFVTGLNSYKKGAQPSDESSAGKTVNYPFLTKSNVKNLENNLYQLTISGKVSDIIYALNDTELLDQINYNKIYKECCAQQPLSPANLSMYSPTIFDDSQTKSKLKSQHARIPSPDDIIHQLQKDPALWTSLLEHQGLLPELLNTTASKIKTEFNQKQPTSPQVLV
jgi:hypothetical protein